MAFTIDRQVEMLELVYGEVSSIIEADLVSEEHEKLYYDTQKYLLALLIKAKKKLKKKRLC